MNYKRSAESTIAGYLYQFDKSIIEVLKLDNLSDSIVIEGIEDIEDIDIEQSSINPISVQVKYYDESEYNHSIIAEAIRQLLYNFIEYLNGNSNRRTYIIYGHYKSGTEKLLLNEDGSLSNTEEKSALEILKEKFLTYSPREGEVKKYYDEEIVEYRDEAGDIKKRSITDDELTDFIKLLKINLKAKSLKEQYNEVSNLLIEHVSSCNSKKEADEYFYNNALKVIFRLAQLKSSTGVEKELKAKTLNETRKSLKSKIEYRIKRIEDGLGDGEVYERKIREFENELDGVEENISKLREEAQQLHLIERTVTKGDFLELIDQKAFFFNKWYAAYKGISKYQEYVKDILMRRKSLNHAKNKFLIIGNEYLSNMDSPESISINEFVKMIIDDSFQLGTALATKNKVWTLVLDIKKTEFKNIVKSLIEEEFEINTGNEEYNFSLTKFNKKPILNTNKSGVIENASYQIKLITLDTFKKYSEGIEDIDVAIFFMHENYNEYLKKLKNKRISSYIVDGLNGKSLDDIAFLFDKKTIVNDHFRVISVTPNLLQIEVTKPNKFKSLNENFSLGSYIKITDDKDSSIIGILKSYKIKDINDTSKITYFMNEPTFILDIQPIGHIVNGEFRKGNKSITIPPSEVEVASNELLNSIFKQENKDKSFSFGNLPGNLTLNEEEIAVSVDGDKFFNKHLAVVGSTGCGKSCTVAKILHEGISPFTRDQKHGVLNNSHIILFDLHGEYHSSFKDKARFLEVKNLQLPYWLMNSEELQDYFLDVEGSDHNQRNIFKKAVTLNKQWNNPVDRDGAKYINTNITYDTPVYFNIKEVLNCIDNYNRARSKEGIYQWTNEPENVKDIMPTDFSSLEMYSKLFTERLEGVTGTGTKQASLSFTNFINRLENKIYDDRLQFLLKKGENFRVPLNDVIKQFIGYKTKFDDHELTNKNITIIDLSGMPFEIINIVVALVSRMIFRFAFERKKYVEQGIGNEVPFLLVYEEAHNYIPKLQEVKYKSVRESVERIAKEGRKYGVSAMIVSQRPSEISETIFSQCNSFVVMRLTNPVDQNYIKRLLPEDVSSITDNLSAFEKREALVLGDSVKMPALVKVHKLPEELLPKSNDVNFIQEWRNDWYEMGEFEDIIKNMTVGESIVFSQENGAVVSDEDSGESEGVD